MILMIELTCEIIGMNSVFYKLPQTVFVHVNAAGLTMMNVTFNYCRIGARFHFEASYSIVMNVVFLEVALKVKRNKINNIDIIIIQRLEDLIHPMKIVNKYIQHLFNVRSNLPCHYRM